MAEHIRTEQPVTFVCARCERSKTSQNQYRYRGGYVLCNGCHGHVSRFGSGVFK